MKIRWRTVGPFVENCYLVIDETTQRSIVVDPGEESSSLIKLVEESGTTLEAIWLTHSHLDHIGGLRGVRVRWPVPVFMHPSEHPVFERAADAARLYGVSFEQPEYPDQDLADGEELTVGSLRFRVMHTPGHAPGHVVFVGEGIALGGDLLFAGSIGRTDLPFCDPVAMEASLERMSALDPAIVVYPGHGPPTTIGAELATNPFLCGAARPLRG